MASVTYFLIDPLGVNNSHTHALHEYGMQALEPAFLGRLTLGVRGQLDRKLEGHEEPR